MNLTQMNVTTERSAAGYLVIPAVIPIRTETKQINSGQEQETMNTKRILNMCNKRQLQKLEKQHDRLRKQKRAF